MHRGALLNSAADISQILNMIRQMLGDDEPGLQPSYDISLISREIGQCCQSQLRLLTMTEDEMWSIPLRRLRETLVLPMHRFLQITFLKTHPRGTKLSQRAPFVHPLLLLSRPNINAIQQKELIALIFSRRASDVFANKVLLHALHHDLQNKFANWGRPG
jgi:hypothetical protein